MRNEHTIRESTMVSITLSNRQCHQLIFPFRTVARALISPNCLSISLSPKNQYHLFNYGEKCAHISLSLSLGLCALHSVWKQTDLFICHQFAVSFKCHFRCKLDETLGNLITKHLNANRVDSFSVSLSISVFIRSVYAFHTFFHSSVSICSE